MSSNTRAVQKAIRLVDLLRRFEAGEAIRPDVVAEEYNMSLRTIQYDLAVLQSEPFYLPIVTVYLHMDAAALKLAQMCKEIA